MLICLAFHRPAVLLHPMSTVSNTVFSKQYHTEYYEYTRVDVFSYMLGSHKPKSYSIYHEFECGISLGHRPKSCSICHGPEAGINQSHTQHITGQHFAWNTWYHVLNGLSEVQFIWNKPTFNY